MERPKTLVVDASVAVKWFTREEGSDEALGLLKMHIDGDVTLAAPDLLIWEVVNALRYNPGFGRSIVSQALEDLLDFQLKTFPSSVEWAGESIAVAFEKGITIYDAAYLGLARWLRGSLCTADSAFLKKVDDPLVIPLEKGIL